MCSKVKSKKRQIYLKQVVKSRKVKILDWLIMTDSFFACEDPSTWLYQIKLKKAVSRALSKVQHYRITCFVTHFPGPNSTPAKFANVWQIQLSWITVVKFDTASGVHFSVTFLVLPSSSWLLKVPNHARLANTHVVSRWIMHSGLSPPPRFLLGIPIKIAIIEKIESARGTIHFFPSCPARSLFFFSPTSLACESDRIFRLKFLVSPAVFLGEWN